ncbi:MAG: NTP transferase domain-containing protein, partial [Candidatus Eisenbacteria bacterium]|nr:NTP transferase domain-containing protein [Candidatus Eisenbacteria bacterium]
MSQDRGTAGNRGRTWAIILAGGEGTRLAGTIESWLGDARPKQYCTFVGSRSMLQHTVDRAAQVVSRRRIVAVIAGHHRQFFRSALRSRFPGIVLEQPADRGTAAGLFAALSQILARDARAKIIVMPSDHFIAPERRFCRQASLALRLAGRCPAKLVLMGARPDRAETDYGWIVPGRAKGGADGGRRLADVEQFVEKPDNGVAQRLCESGGLWSTLVLAADARRLWMLGRSLAPEVMPCFDLLRRQLLRTAAGHSEPIPLSRRMAALYECMPSCDLSRDI